MVQTKLSVAFILAAVAIAPIIAVPLRAAYPEQTRMAVEPKAASEAGSNAAPVVAPQQSITDEVERKPLHSGIGDHLEQLQPTSQGTDSNKRKGRNGKGRRGKGHKGKGRKGKGHKHRKAVDLQVVPHKAQSQENAYLNDHLSARDDSAEKFERSLDDIDLATDLAARDDSEMFERSFDHFEPEYEAREYGDLD